MRQPPVLAMLAHETLLRHRGSNLNVFLGVTFDAEGGARQTPFMEEEDRR